jgi:hypothetical protein
LNVIALVGVEERHQAPVRKQPASVDGIAKTYLLVDLPSNPTLYLLQAYIIISGSTQNAGTKRGNWGGWYCQPRTAFTLLIT